MPERLSTSKRCAAFALRCGAALALFCAGVSANPVRGEEVAIAVAANFLVPLRAIAAEFEAATGHHAVVISGSTGQLYAQIVNGAPFDVLLAADRERPARLADEGYAVPGSVFTYAVGRLALWSRDPDLIDERALEALGERDFRWIAIANPALAPYGVAAREALARLGLWEAFQPRLVRGQNIAQTFALIETRNAELGFVALSQALGYEHPASYLVVPETLHGPIRQDAVVLERAEHNAGARALVVFLRGPDAAAIAAHYGYAVPGPAD